MKQLDFNEIRKQKSFHVGGYKQSIWSGSPLYKPKTKDLKEDEAIGLQ